MAIPLRNSVRVLLLNEKNDLLLMCAEDPKTRSVNGTAHKRFWYCVGGQIEENESLEQAAFREIHEETGIPENAVTLGPIVWFGEFDLVLNGILTHLKQTFIVATTTQEETFLHKPDEWEQQVVKNMGWFTFSKIQESKEPIFPVLLPQYLPPILAGQYPKQPIEIDLAKQP